MNDDLYFPARNTPPLRKTFSLERVVGWEDGPATRSAGEKPEFSGYIAKTPCLFVSGSAGENFTAGAFRASVAFALTVSVGSHRPKRGFTTLL